MSLYTRPVMKVKMKNILHNYNLLKNVAKNSVCSAVVKDDSYGVGSVEVSKYLFENGNCRDFFVAHSLEGKEIRPYVGDSNIYVLQGMGIDSIDEFKENSLIPVINSLEQLEFWQNNKIDSLDAVLHVDTGLNRLGLSLDDVKSLSDDVRGQFSLVMSHLACGDEANHFMNNLQLDNFNNIKKYFTNAKFSLSASDGVFLENDFSFDMVRLGASLYGINTTPYRENKMKNVIEISAPIIKCLSVFPINPISSSVTFPSKSVVLSDGFVTEISQCCKLSTVAYHFKGT